jgi:hypothetical protein
MKFQHPPRQLKHQLRLLQNARPRLPSLLLLRLQWLKLLPLRRSRKLQRPAMLLSSRLPQRRIHPLTAERATGISLRQHPRCLPGA